MTKHELHDLLNSWENIELLIHEALTHPEYVRLIADIAFYSDHPKSWRAAWLMDKIHNKKPKMIEPFIKEIILQLKKETSSSKIRHFLKLISLYAIPKNHSSFLFEYCHQHFTSAKEPVAVRVYALQVLYNLSEEEPDLKPELLSTIRYENELHSTAGIRSRGKKLAKKLQQQINASGIHLT